MPTTSTTDLDIARSVTPRPLSEIGVAMGLNEHHLQPYGPDVAKVSLDAIGDLADRPAGKYVVITAVTPTPFGEGKTMVAVGLGQAMAQIGKRAVVTLRQPSLGPTFGIKGGAAGGGRSQVIPMERLNLHLTGDFHAVTAAHNLLAAMIDNELYHHSAAELDAGAITWPRVLDVNDRALRNIVVGLGSQVDGIPRQSGFDITAASEVMAIVALATSPRDLRDRLGRIVIGDDVSGRPVTADQISAAGAMAVILSEALQPNLLQTLEHTPVIVHTGPFGNIAHGASSVVADQIAMRTSDYVLTEAGFGADMGAERFFNIKCRASGLAPDAAVVVATVRALKAHSGNYEIAPGHNLPAEMLEENSADVLAGGANLAKQIDNVRAHGVTPVVAVNAFATDHPSELEAIKQLCDTAGVRSAVCTSFADGGDGAAELAQAVVEACDEPSDFRFLYADEDSLTDKIERVATKIYGAGRVDYTPKATAQLARYESEGFAHLPVCIAKTHLSLSADPTLMGAPSGHTVTVREARLAAGAGFVLPICGDMRTMPGLSASPAATRIDMVDGQIEGLS